METWTKRLSLSENKSMPMSFVFGYLTERIDRLNNF